jgi:hypothetical protein
MREILEIPPEEITPDPARVLTHLGVPPHAAGTRDRAILQSALHLFTARAAPEAVMAEVSPEEFVRIYRGADRNEPVTPLVQVFPRADGMALFALTMGEEVSREILRRFASRDFALGSMLDAVASEATERAGDLLERRYREAIATRGVAGPTLGVLRYSPGYCGWHISGQEKLFTALRPGEIGISLRESYLMQPLKSMSGVIVAGERGIHVFEDNYPFCRECRARGCRARIRRIMEAG